MKIFRNRAFRWVLLMIGLVAIIALTGMNVLSLYDLRDQMVESEEERRIDQLDEITTKVRHEMYDPFYGLSRLELEPIEASIEQTGQFPKKIREVLFKASQTRLFKGIYYTPAGVDPCDEGTEIYVYNYDTHKVNLSPDYPELLCDGVGLVRTKAKIQLNDFDYRWNNIVEFDTHRSMNLGLINLSESRPIGYLTFNLDADYIVDELISPLIKDYFEPSDKSGIIVWLHDWAKNEILATNDPSLEYDRDLVSHRHSFPNFFGNWNIKIGFLQTPIANVYNATLVKNLVVLGVAGLFLFGALIFMFITAQRERNLAQRQASFLANVTHELKTPLAVMQAAGENISDGRVTETGRLKQYGKHIYRESIRLRRMIEKLLDVAKVDSGQSMIHPAPHRMLTLMKNFMDENREYLEEKGFEVNFEARDEDSVIMIDDDSFEAIISNLTENAVKYSPDDKYIKYVLDSNKDSVWFSITDHGVGIPKGDLKNIYKKFYRVEDSLSAKTKGHGLGLSIVKNMVDLNEGEIKVKSTPGAGTTFTVIFPKLAHQENALNQGENDITSDEKILEQTEHVG